MTADVRLVVVKNGREWPGVMMLDPGERISSRYFDPERGCHVVELAVDGVPPSAEVLAGGRWVCEERGHRFVSGNQCCMECGATFGSDKEAA